jgi:hypothetical protein
MKLYVLDVPLTTVVNKILRNHIVSSQRSSTNIDYIIAGKDFFRRVFSSIDENSIEECGRELGYAVVNEYISSFFPEINSRTLIDTHVTHDRRQAVSHFD